MPKKKSKKRKETDLEWLDKHALSLRTFNPELIRVSTVSYAAHYWTALKLISLGYFADIYSQIIPRRFSSTFYIDFFAGCGVNFLEEQCYVPGSPIIVLEKTKRYPLGEYHFFEKNPERLKALKSRLNYISGEDEFTWLSENRTFFCYKGDCISQIDRMKLRIQEAKNPHALIFIDPEGFQFTFPNLKKLLDLPADIMYVFMTSSIQRKWGEARNGDLPSIKLMNNLFGNSSWQNSQKAIDLVDIFTKQIRNEGKIVKSINIRGRPTRKTNQPEFNYQFLLITRPTKGGNPWLEAIDRLKNHIEKTGGDLARSSFTYLAGNSSRVSDFFSS